MTSHLAQLEAVETKAFKIIGISHDEAESMGLSHSHLRQVGGLSVFYHLFSDLVPSVLPMLSPPLTFMLGARSPPSIPFW